MPRHAALVLLLCCASVHGHTYTLAKCPVVAGMDDFNFEQFTGRWHIVGISSAMNPCMSLYYSPGGEEGSVTVSQQRELAITNTLNVPHRVTYEGTATPSGGKPSEMVIKWPVSGFIFSGILGQPMQHTIVATDYGGLAATWECQNLAIGSRQSAAILSRTRNPDEEKVKQLRQTMAQLGVRNVDGIDKVDQSACTPPEDVLDVNLKDFGLLKKEELPPGQGVDDAL